MTLDQVKIGTRVKSNRDFSGVPCGTTGVIDQLYETGFMVAWDLPNQPLPDNYHVFDGRPCIATRILRDGFDAEKELQFLEVVK